MSRTFCADRPASRCEPVTGCAPAVTLRSEHRSGVTRVLGGTHGLAGGPFGPSLACSSASEVYALLLPPARPPALPCHSGRVRPNCAEPSVPPWACLCCLSGYVLIVIIYPIPPRYTLSTVC